MSTDTTKDKINNGPTIEYQRAIYAIQAQQNNNFMADLIANTETRLDEYRKRAVLVAINHSPDQEEILRVIAETSPEIIAKGKHLLIEAANEMEKRKQMPSNALHIPEMEPVIAAIEARSKLVEIDGAQQIAEPTAGVSKSPVKA